MTIKYFTKIYVGNKFESNLNGKLPDKFLSQKDASKLVNGRLVPVRSYSVIKRDFKQSGRQRQGRL